MLYLMYSDLDDITSIVFHRWTRTRDELHRKLSYFYELYRTVNCKWDIIHSKVRYFNHKLFRVSIRQSPFHSWLSTCKGNKETN
jgi:hypothetical protein